MKIKKKKLQGGGQPPAPIIKKDKNKQLIDLSLIGNGEDERFQGYQTTQLDTSFNNLDPEIQKNYNYLTGRGEYSNFNPDDFNVPKDFLPENYNFGPIPSRSRTTGKGLFSSQSQGEMEAYDLARKGIVRNVNGEIVNMNDEEGVEWDEKTWWDKVIGVAGATEDKLLRRTVDYMPLWKTKADEEAQKKDKAAYEQKAQDDAYGAKSLIFPHMVQKMFTSYKYAGYYPKWDEESQQYILQETYLDEPEFNRIRGAILNPYGPAAFSKSPIGALIDGFSHTMGSLGPDLLNFAELTTDIAEASYNLAYGTGEFDSDPNGWTDRWAAQARANTEFHNYAKSAMEQTDDLFANGTVFAGGLGSGIASLLQFWGIGGAAAKGAIRLAKFLTPANKAVNTKFASLVGHIAGGTPINAGEIYKQAKMDGLDDDEAALMSLAVGVVNSVVEYSVGSNYLANRAFGHVGQRAIYKSLFDISNKANMKVNKLKFLDEMTGPIFKSIFNALERVGVDGPKLFRRAGRGLSSGIEEGTEEIIQGTVLQSTKQGYNWIKEDDESLRQGEGKFSYGKFDMEQLLYEGTLGFILGGGVRTIMNTAYEPDLMTLIMDGKAKNIYEAIDHLNAKGALSDYQRNKLKKRVAIMEAYANENAPAWSRLDAKGQYIVGQALLHNENYKHKLENLQKRRAKVEGNDNLTDAAKQKKLDLLKAEELALNNLKDINNTMLEYFGDPNLVKKYNLSNLPQEIASGLSQLAWSKSRLQFQKQKLLSLINDVDPKNKREFNRLLNKLRETKEGKELADTLEIQKLLREGKTQEAIDKLVAELDKRIDQHDTEINKLLTVPEEWSAYKAAVKEKMKTDEERQNEEEGPLSKKDGTEKAEDPNETMEEKRKRKKQEKIEKEKRDLENKDKFSREVAGERVEGPLSTHVRYGNKKHGEILHVEEKGGKKVYVLKEKDKDGKNIEVTEGKNVHPYLDPFQDDNPSKHKANFLKTYWLQVGDVVSMGTLTAQEFQKLLNTDRDLINHIQIEFVNVPRTLNKETAKKEKNMYINMQGSYLRIVDKRNNKLIAVLKTSNRFYNLDETLIPGDKMSLEFFNNNMNKSGKPFSEEQYAEFQRNYTVLDKMFTKLEELYPGASNTSPQRLDDSMFSFNFYGKPISLSDSIKKRLLIDTTGSELTYNGEYVIYDNLSGKIILGKKPSKNMMSRLPGENFEGRYFALTNYDGNMANWIRVFPSTVDPKEVETRLKTLKRDITRLNNYIKQGTSFDSKQELKDINKKLDMFIALKGGYTIKVHADFDRKTNKYQLSIHAQRVDAEGNYESIEGLTNLRLPNNASLNTIINTINKGLANYKKGPQITINSFKKSIPDDGSEITPSNFESSVAPGKNFANATMSIEVSDDLFKMQEPPQTEDIAPEDIIDPSDIIGLEDDTEQDAGKELSVEEIEAQRKEEIENYYKNDKEGSQVSDPAWISMRDQIENNKRLHPSERAYFLKYLKTLFKLKISHEEMVNKFNKMLKGDQKYAHVKPIVYMSTPIDFINEKYDKLLAEKTKQEEKESYTTDEAIENLKKKLGGEMSNYDTNKNRLNNGVRKDLLSQLFAQLKDGKIDVAFDEDVDNALESIFDRYVEGITIKSFFSKDKPTVSKEELKVIEDKARFAMRQKTILKSKDFDKEGLFDTVKESYNYLPDETSLVESIKNWDMDNTERGLDSFPAKIKQFISMLTYPATDIFGRTTWQSEKYGTTEIIKTLDGHFVMGNLMMLLSNQGNQSNIMVRLKAISKYDPQMALVLQALNNNPSIRSAFIEVFNRFELGYKKILIKDNKATIIDPVLSDAPRQILDTWYSRSSAIDIKTKRRAIKEITMLLDEKGDTSYKNIDKLVNAFDKLGWTITETTAGYLLGDQVLRDAYPELVYIGMDSLKGFLGKLSSYNKKPNSIKDTDNLYKLARIEGMFSPITYEPNYRDAEGKSRYRYIQRNYILDTSKKIKEGRFNERFIELPNNVLKGKTSGIEIKMAGDFVITDEDLETGATNKTLTSAQRLLLAYTLFGDTELSDHAYYIPNVVADKKALYAIRLPKKEYYKNGVTQLAIDDVFNSLFVREFERNLNEETRQTGGNYFFYLDQLNDMKIADPDGKMITVPEYLANRTTLDGIEDDIKNKIIKPALEAQIAKNKERIEQLKLEEEISNLQVDVNPSIGDLDHKIGNLVLNHFIMGANFNQLMFGDHGYKNGVDYNKRLSGPNASGTKKGNINFRYVMIEDDILSEEEAFGSKDVSANDAQAIITDKMLALRELETDLIKSDKEKAIYEKLKRSLEDPDAYPTQRELNLLDLNSTKTVYFDGVAFQPLNGGRYFKKSDFILTKQFAEEQAAAGNPKLLNIYNKLNDKQIMYLYTNTVSKLKSDPAISKDFFNTEKDINDTDIYEGNLEYELNQVVNETKSRYGIETFATQPKQLHDLIGSVSTTPASRVIADAIIESNAKSKEGYFQVLNTLMTIPELEPALRAALIEEIGDTRSSNILEMLKEGNYNNPLIYSIVRQTFVNMMNKDSVRSQVTGNVATLASGSFVVNPQTGQPLKIHRDVDGNIEYAEILASRKMFGLEKYKNIKDVPSDLLKAFGTRLPTQAHHSMIPLKVVGFLPNANGDTIITPRQLPAIAGSDYDLDKLFLHRYATTINSEGKKVRLPSDLTTEEQMVYWGKNKYIKLAQEALGMGLLETLHMFGVIKSNATDENIVLVPHPLVEQNNMLDNMFKLFNTPEVKEVMFKPATEGVAREFAEKYGLDKEFKESIHTLTGMLDYHEQNKIGAINIGIAANANSLYSLLTQNNKILKGGITIDGITYNQYNKIYEDDVDLNLELKENTRSKFDSMSSIITLFVDNVKLGLAPQINLTSEMTSFITHFIALGAGQTRGFMIINQPILLALTEAQSLDPKLFEAGEGYTTISRYTKIINKRFKELGIKRSKLTTKNLHAGLKTNLNFKDVIKKNKKDLTPQEIKFLQVQKTALDTVDYLIEGKHKYLLAQTIATTKTVKGFDSVAISDNRKTVQRRSQDGNIYYIRKREKLLDAMVAAYDAHNINKVLIHNIKVLRGLGTILTPSIDGLFLPESVTHKAFVKAYPNQMNKEEVVLLIKKLQELKKDPKYADNKALQGILKIRNGKIIVDSQVKMSTEIEGQIVGSFEDLFIDNPTLADDLLRYLFATTKLRYVNNSFLKFLPKAVFDKYDAALNEVQETGVVPENKPKFIQAEQQTQDATLNYEFDTESQLEEDKFKPGTYTINEIKEELGVKEFGQMFENLNKSEKVTVVYNPKGKNSFYNNGIITLHKLDEELFLEEAFHAAIDLLPKEEKTKLRKDVLKWYKELVDRHPDESKATQKIFNRYVSSNTYTEEQAAEELITHLIYRDSGLIQELNELRSPNEKGILESMWSKFIKLVAKYLGIEIKSGTELERLANLLQPVDKVIMQEIEYDKPGRGLFNEDGTFNVHGYESQDSETMFNLPPGESEMFDSARVFTTAENISKLLVGEEFSQLVFDGEMMPIVESIVNVYQFNGSDHGKAVIIGKQAYREFADLKSKQNDLAQSLGYKNVEDWKKNATQKEKAYIDGFRTEAMVLKLKIYESQKYKDVVNMNSIDKDRNVTNNVLLLLYKQLQQIEGGNVKNTEFVKNRKARLQKIIAEVKVAQDVFNSVDDFFDDVSTQHALLTKFLENKEEKTIEQLIDGLTKYRILMEDMAFINELPHAFREKLKNTKYNEDEKMLKKLQDSVNMIEDMRRQLRKEYIPVLAAKLYPMITRSGVETKKYVETLLEDMNKQIAKIQTKVNKGKMSKEEGNDKIRRERGRITKFKKLAEQAPESEEAFAKFLMYSSHDMDWLGFMFMAPSTTSDPGLAALIQYTYSLAIEARREAINISNELETLDNIYEEGLKERGEKISNSPIKYYKHIIELVNHRGTYNEDVWALVTKYDIAMYEEALEQEELKLAKQPEKIRKLRALVLLEYKEKIEYLGKEVAGLEAMGPDLNLENEIAAKKAEIDRLKAILADPNENLSDEQILRRGTRKWISMNRKEKSVDEIRAIMNRQSDVKSWAKGQMNAPAQYQLGIINKEEFDMIKAIQESVYGVLLDEWKPKYWGHQVTRPNDKYINKKWSALYDKNDNPKNKLGEAHQGYTNIYRDSLAKVYKKQRVDMALPSIRKGLFDRMLENQTFEGLKQEAKRLFEVDEDDAFVYGSAVLEEQTRNYAPVYFMEEIDASEVNLDVKMGLMTFANAALRTEQNNEVLKLAYMLRDVYNENRIVDPAKSDPVGLNKLSRKIANVKQGESYVARKLEKYIEMVLLGQTKNVEMLPGTDLQIDKVIDNILSFTAITTLGLDFLKGTRNYITAVWQQGIEAGAGTANKGKVSLKEFIGGHKIMLDPKNVKLLMEDKYQKLGNKSYLGQLLLYFNAIQGNFEDFATGKQTLGNVMLRQSIFNPDSLLINYHMGEVAAQGAAAIAILKKRNVIVNGKETSLYDAFRINKKTGNFEFAGTKEEAKKAQETIRIATEEIQEMNIRLNGNYTSVEKEVISQSAAGRMLLLFRKFLVPTVMNRWRVDYVNHQKGEPDGGFYRRAIGNMWRSWKTSAESDLIKKALDTYRRSTLTPQDKEAVMKTMHEITLLAILSAVVSILMGMQDDDDEELSVAGYYLLYWLTTTRAEIMAFAPTPTAAGEFLRILRSPTAMTTSIERTMKLLNQLGAPLEEYQRDAGPWKKGENKLKVRALQWIGRSKLQTDPETALRNFLMITNK